MSTYRELDRIKLDHADDPVVDDAGDNVRHDDTALDVEDAFGEHDIEYWVRKGSRLVPATEAEIAQIQAWERERKTVWRLTRLKAAERLEQRWSARLLRSLRAVRFWRVPTSHSAAQRHAGKQHS